MASPIPHSVVVVPKVTEGSKSPSVLTLRFGIKSSVSMQPDPL